MNTKVSYSYMLGPTDTMTIFKYLTISLRDYLLCTFWLYHIALFCSRNIVWKGQLWCKITNMLIPIQIIIYYNNNNSIVFVSFLDYFLYCHPRELKLFFIIFDYMVFLKINAMSFYFVYVKANLLKYIEKLNFEYWM